MHPVASSQRLRTQSLGTCPEAAFKVGLQRCFAAHQNSPQTRMESGFFEAGTMPVTSLSKQPDDAIKEYPRRVHISAQ
jgi:hypothetical protein